MSKFQELLYAHNRRSMLLISQGLYAAGKDSTIKHVTSGVSPAGFQVFIQPTFPQRTRPQRSVGLLARHAGTRPDRHGYPGLGERAQAQIAAAIARLEGEK